VGQIEKGKVYRNKNAWEAFSRYVQQQTPSKIIVMTDANTNAYCLPYFFERVAPEQQPDIIAIPEGEANKTIDTCKVVWEKLSNMGADKNSLIINLGGGVVTDLGGFVASTFKRGVPFINVPTSLLAMVDASVGGKNGVDLAYLKNQIGTINLPEMVILDHNFLKTLPSSHITSGYAEMLKHGIIHSKENWDRVKNVDFSDDVNLEALIWESINIKQEIVTKDPLEKSLRKTLNYGHTLGHAIESYFLGTPEKKNLFHGEAVAVGIVLASYISMEKYGFSKDALHEITKCVFRHFQKQIFNKNEIDLIIKLLNFDKKNFNGQVCFVLLEDFGKYKIDYSVSNKLIYSAFNYYKNL